MSNINRLLEGLNDRQKEVVQAVNGKYLVLASAGSGKTRSIIHRIAYLIEIGIKPWEIVAISFTKKASNEIKERIHKLIGEDSLEINMGTFHSLCMRILYANQAAIGMSNLTVLNEGDAEKIIKDLAFTYGYSAKDEIGNIQRSIDKWGNHGWSPAVASQKEHVFQDHINIYSDYINFKRSVGYIDFNDIISLTVEMFDRRPDILLKYSMKYKHIIIDESQDVNDLQQKLIYQLSSYHHNYMLIGDDFQIIYSFRGSNIRNILNVRNNDSEVKTILLEQNYRSSKTIVEASNHFIRNNKNQLEKTSFTTNSPGHPIFIYDSEDESKETEFIVSIIDGLVRQKGYQYDDFAVLYRNNFLSRNVELALGLAGIPYEVVAGNEFFNREEIKSLVAYLRAIDNHSDDLAFERIMESPKRGIGAATINRLRMFAGDAQVSLATAMEQVEDVAKINKPTKKKILDTISLVEEGRNLLKEEDTTILDVLRFIITKSKFMDQYDREKSIDEQRIQNIQELWNVAAQFDRQEHAALEEGQSLLTQFLTETALYAKPTDEEEQAKVSLLTAHSSKGLEFRVVFIISAQKDTFPSYMTRTPEEMEEERRLMYVSMTRAKEMLFVSYNRKKYFQGREVEAGPSPFISEIPREYVRYLGIRKPEENNDSDY